MYIHTHNDLGQGLPQSQSTSPKLSAADLRVLRKAASLARSIHTAIREIEQSIKFLATPAQQDLMREIVGILRTFFPSGFGVKQKNGVAIKGSTRYRTDVPSKSPSQGMPFYMPHDTRLFISFEKSIATGRQWPFTPGSRNWIHLYADHLSTDTASLARVLIHETIHMLSHRYRSVEEKFGARAASEIPTRAAGALLDRSSFDPLRHIMEKHFLKLIEFLNQQPHRAGNVRMAQSASEVAKTWGAHMMEEVLAFVLTERFTSALAKLRAGKSSIGMSQDLVPMQFLKDYFRNYWLSEREDRAALKTKESDRVFGAMEADLMKLVAAVQKQVGP